MLRIRVQPVRNLIDLFHDAGQLFRELNVGQGVFLRGQFGKVFLKELQEPLRTVRHFQNLLQVILQFGVRFAQILKNLVVGELQAGDDFLIFSFGDEYFFIQADMGQMIFFDDFLQAALVQEFFRIFREVSQQSD